MPPLSWRNYTTNSHAPVPGWHDDAGAETLARHGITAGAAAAVERNPNDPASWGKVGRNESCPCGSGKKFKHCHGRFA